MWCAALPTFFNEEDALAVCNIFFSSWGAFITAMLLATSLFQKFFERHDDKNLFHWVGFGTAAVIVMASASRFWQENNCENADDSDSTCKRTMFAIVLGAISGLVGFGLVMLRVRIVEQIGSIFLLAVWCFAAGYITYDQGPGNAVGTLYFSTWAALFFALNVAAVSIKELFEAATTSTNTEETAPAGAPVAGKPGADPKAALGEDQESEEVEQETA
jgi:putative Mn2+ efflux pump MntP